MNLELIALDATTESTRRTEACRASDVAEFRCYYDSPSGSARRTDEQALVSYLSAAITPPERDRMVTMVREVIERADPQSRPAATVIVHDSPPGSLTDCLAGAVASASGLIHEPCVLVRENGNESIGAGVAMTLSTSIGLYRRILLLTQTCVALPAVRGDKAAADGSSIPFRETRITAAIVRERALDELDENSLSIETIVCDEVCSELYDAMRRWVRSPVGERGKATIVTTKARASCAHRVAGELRRGTGRAIGVVVAERAPLATAFELLQIERGGGRRCFCIDPTAARRQAGANVLPFSRRSFR